MPGRQLRLLAGMALFFFVAAALLLLYCRWREQPERWFAAPQLLDLQRQIALEPANADLKQRFRDEDARLRRQYFRERRRLRLGTWVLAGAGLAAFLAAHAAAASQPQPQPALPPAPEAEIAARKRQRRLGLALQAALGAGGAAALLILFFAGAPEEPLAQRQAPESAGTVPDPAFVADAAAMARNWPGFRGPQGNGVAMAEHAWPLAWDAASGAGIAWKTDVPGTGNNSPVVWNDKIFCTSASGVSDQMLHCFSAADGRLLWSVPATAPRRNAEAFLDVAVMKETGYAAPTAATNGSLVYVTFASADILAFDFTGRQVWARNFGVPESAYGLASSLLCYENLVLWQLDQGADERARRSAVYGLDAATGNTLWRTPRPTGNTWSSPVLAENTAGVELLLCGNPHLIAYDPRTGRELWRAKTSSGDIGASPAHAGGVVFVTSASMHLAAVRGGGSGDVSASHVLWTAADGMPDTASLLTNGRQVLQATSDGLVTCFNASSGELLWEEHFDCGFEASPLLAGNLVYLWGNNGRAWIFELGEKYTLKNTGDIGEPLRATPAMVGGRIFVRGERCLYCIAPAAAEVP